MGKLLLRLVNWLLDRLAPVADPFPLKRPDEWDQRHRRTAGDMLESQGQIIPPPRGKKRS